MSSNAEMQRSGERLDRPIVTHTTAPTHLTSHDDVAWAAAFLTRSDPDQSREKLERNIEQNVRGYTGGCGPNRPSWQYTARGLVVGFPGGRVVRVKWNEIHDHRACQQMALPMGSA
jgi:hypothetical protein